MVTAPSADSTMVITAAQHSVLHQDRSLQLVAVDTARAVTCTVVSTVDSIWDAVNISIPFSITNQLNSHIMNTKFFTLLIMVMLTLTSNSQGKTRSYFCQQINAPVSTGPTATLNQATFVEWDDDDNIIRMMDGTEWRYQGMRNGCHIYSFYRATGMIMPGTQYQSAVFSGDFSMMRIYYVFGVGMPGFAVQMNAFYKYIDEGR